MISALGLLWFSVPVCLSMQLNFACQDLPMAGFALVLSGPFSSSSSFESSIVILELGEMKSSSSKGFLG